MFVERTRMHSHHGGAEHVEPVLVSHPAEKSVPRPAVVGEIADAHQALAPILQLEAARVELNAPVMKLQICLSIVEHIALVRSDETLRQTQRMRIDELDIPRQPARRPHLQASIYAGRLKQLIVAGEIAVRRPVLGPASQLKVNRRPLRKHAPMQRLHLAQRPRVLDIMHRTLLAHRSPRRQHHEHAQPAQPSSPTRRSRLQSFPTSLNANPSISYRLSFHLLSLLNPTFTAATG